MTAEQDMTREQVRDIAVRIGGELGVPVRIDEPLAPYLSMRVGGTVPAFLVPGTVDDVARIVRELSRMGVPHRLLGGGSNLLAAETGLDFAVVHVGAADTTPEWDGPRVTAAAGLPLAALLREAMKRSLTGLEWAAGLPGTIGGAAFGNAGAFGGEIGSSITGVTVLGANGDVRSHAVQPGDFRYRRSFLAAGETVLTVTLELAPGDPKVIRDEVARVNKTRAGSQPKGGHSSGCVFKNPEGGHAGKLIDESGLKGLRVGGATVSPSHGNFIINDGSATASDILELIRQVRIGVRARTGLTLEVEVQVWPSRDVLDGANS